MSVTAGCPIIITFIITFSGNIWVRELPSKVQYILFFRFLKNREGLLFRGFSAKEEGSAWYYGLEKHYFERKTAKEYPFAEKPRNNIFRVKTVNECSFAVCLKTKWPWENRVNCNLRTRVTSYVEKLTLSWSPLLVNVVCERPLTSPHQIVCLMGTGTLLVLWGIHQYNMLIYVWKRRNSFFGMGGGGIDPPPALTSLSNAFKFTWLRT